MTVLIIEDEPVASKRLINLLKKYDVNIEILAVLPSVKKSCEWFNTKNEPDLAFFDIQLGDGLSFEIFEKTRVNCPIIFTTAYDEYALKAFKVNSIDYLLKPVDFKELKKSVEKYKLHFESKHNKEIQQLPQINELIKMLGKSYKERFIVKVGTHLKPIEIKDILFFYSLEKATYIHTNESRNFVINHSLDQLESLLDPAVFFRINRKYIINISAVKDIVSYSKNRMKIILKNSDHDDLIVSREKLNKFKSWLD